MKQLYKAGIDIGSTTVKIVILDDKNKIIYSEYKRHYANIEDVLKSLLYDVSKKLGNCDLQINVTGSGAINISKALNIGFIQEVEAVAFSLKRIAPNVDVAIELGGEDAKIIYFDGGIEERMNGVCAGGTGAFIDQMASLLQTDAMGLNELAENYKVIYPIAARCGVFAKSDIQPLINDGASKADLAASIFQAVVNQTISGLACGKPIRGCVAFLGGPLHFLPELKNAFIRKLSLTEENIVAPENSHLFAALGAALKTDKTSIISLNDLILRINSGIKMSIEMPRLEPLFYDENEYHEFCDRHSKADLEHRELKSYKGNCYLGVDAGSTTTKLVVIGDKGEILFSYYTNNNGNPITAVQNAISKLKEEMPSEAKIVRSCSTGYGEELLKSAFNLDEGEVETIAHSYAAKFFNPDVDCILDIGGQDMKCIQLKNGSVDNVILNEACSSGCGSFIETFANSLGYSAEEFAQLALFSKSPVDLGTRCTVFMNSNVKQAQKENASVSDISAGLAYSVIKNALYKVIKLTKGSELGKNIVVQGGTFYNQAVLRAFEKIANVDVVCPNISGLMGAFGAALIAREHYDGELGQMLSFDKIENLEYSTSTTHCKSCSNSCMLTINKFSNKRVHISGNRCEKAKQSISTNKKGNNLFEYKRKRIFDYEPLTDEEAYRGTIGIPRVLNMYENYPFWATFFKNLGFKVVLSPFSTRKVYELGMESIPSESECYPAKLAHGHIEWLLQNGVSTIFYPCVFFEKQEVERAQNHYNCPIVVSYSENIKNNVEALKDDSIKYVRPFIAFTDEETAKKRLIDICKEEWNINKDEVSKAVHKAWQEQINAKADIRQEGARILKNMENEKRSGIVLAGRPYHVDPEINHGIPELIASYGFDVYTEDSLPILFNPERPLRVVDQWVYHSRLYTAAEFVTNRNDLELVQLNSFGCGLDAVTTDQVSEILSNSNKLYTLLKIDEVNNLGAARIRIRSLIAAVKMRNSKKIKASPKPVNYKRQEYTKLMQKSGYTLIAPQMSPIHFNLLEPVFKKYNYNTVILDNDNRSAIDVGLKYVNNDACFPSITVVGQIMEAVLSEKYDTNKLAILMTQTGGCCRASNYVGFIRRALDKEGLSHIPVISLNANGMEKNEGFKLAPKMLIDAAHAIIFGDLLMRCLYRTRPYEKTVGSANKLYEKWHNVCVDNLTKNQGSFKAICYDIVQAFDNLPIYEDLYKPRVGVVGEILVKYMPLANNHIVDVIEREGAEAVVPDLIDFLNYSFYNNKYRYKYLGASKSTSVISDLVIKAIEKLRKPAIEALKNSKRFSAPMPIEEIAEITKPILSLGNQYGEGWFLAGEMCELLSTGVNNIICIQPFACLPNHVVGKGVIKKLKDKYLNANIIAIDYDPGASEVNQLNRIKLMLSNAKRVTEHDEDDAEELELYFDKYSYNN